MSGGAYGIDGAAHRGALAADGATICVLAGGVDVRYPRAHDALLGRIAEDGLLVSEVPPGEPVRRQRFLERNRLIAALTRGTIVVEAALRSGTTATAAAAYAMNRPVVAVPGPISSPTSAGCHRMIRDGEAVLGTCIDDVLELVAFGGDEGPRPAAEPTGEVEATPRDRLSDAQRSVLDCLPARGSLAADDLVAAAGLSTSAAWTAVLALESAGWVTRDARGWRLARR